MKTETNYKQAMSKLGITNFLKQFILSIKWVINPNSAIKLAKGIVLNDQSKDKKISTIAVGYMNEFFSKYIEFGKSNVEVVKLNEIIDNRKKTDNRILVALIKLRKIRTKLKKLDIIKKDQPIRTIKSFGVSSGIITGKVLNVISTTQTIPKGCIGIFPTSGVKYTTQFLKCEGIIFKNGSMTSHGAIIAREFSIPAIVYPNLKINNGKTVTINGNTGQINA